MILDGTITFSDATVQSSSSNTYSFGLGQTWQNVLASRASGTTYYNTTGKPIAVAAGANSTGASVIGVSLTMAVNGVYVMSSGTNATYSYPSGMCIVPANGSYVVSISGVAFSFWSELR